MQQLSLSPAYKFSIGDRVMCANGKLRPTGLPYVGSIVHICTGNVYDVKWDRAPLERYIEGSRLVAAVESAPTFKVGDRVRDVQGYGVVIAVLPMFNGQPAYQVDWDDGTSTKRICGQYLTPESAIHNGETHSPAPSTCDCGGWVAGAHSGWCSNPSDNALRSKGLQRLAHKY